MRKIHLTTKDTKSTKFRELILQTFVSFVTFVVKTLSHLVAAVPRLGIWRFVTVITPGPKL